MAALMALKQEVEALLFASGKYLSVSELAKLARTSQGKVEEALKELREDYSKSENALAVVEAGGKWKMSVKNEYVEVAKRIVADAELEMPVLETLAVIAWKKPILQSQVIDMRGEHAYQHIKLLTDLGFVKRERHGRTYKLSLGEKFYEYFDVQSEKEVQELFSVVKKPRPVTQEKREGNKKPARGVVKSPKVDPYEKWKEESKALEEIEKELEEIERKTEESVKEVEAFKKEEPGSEESGGEPQN